MIYSFDLEKRVLSGMLQIPEAWGEIAHLVNDKDFFSLDSKVNSTIFKLLKNSLDRAETIDDTILIQRIGSLSVSFEDGIDVNEYIRSLAYFKINKDLFYNSVRELKKFTARRELYNSAKEIATFAKNVDMEKNYSEIISGADKIYNESIQQFEMVDNMPQLLFEDAENIIEEIADNPLEEYGMMSHHPRLNELYGSLVLPGNISCIVARSGVGKMMPLKQKIKTKYGWKTHGDIKIGDEVECPDGTFAKVNGYFPHKNKDVYRVHFSDGRFADCGLEHLWKCFTRDNRGDYAWDVIDTKELSRKVLHTGKTYVPLVSNTNTKDIDLPINPYVLGVLLGDGCLCNKGSVNVTTGDDEIYDIISSVVSVGKKISSKSNCFTFNLLDPKGELRNTLKKLELRGKKSKEKFIPDIYKNCSFDQKIELIQGLMDTDGHISKYGSLIFYTSSEKLAKDFQELIWSIGGVCRLKEKYTTLNGKKFLSYCLSVRYKDPRKLVRIKRRLDKVPLDYQYKNLKLGVEKVEKLDRKEDCACISIDNSEHLYITDNYVITHNSSFVLDYATHLTAKYKVPVLHFDNGEMSKEELLFRQMSALTGFPTDIFQRGTWKRTSIGGLPREEVVKRVRACWPKIRDLKFYYYNVAGMSSEEMANTLKHFYYSKVGRGNEMVFSFDYIKSDFNNLGKIQDWLSVAQMVDRFKQTIHKQLCFDGKPTVGMITSVQANRSGVTTNRSKGMIVEDESVVALSDAITQFCSHMFLLRKKTNEEIQEEAGKFGTHRLVNLKPRHLGRNPERALNLVELDEDILVPNAINFDFKNFKVEEKGDLVDYADYLMGRTKPKESSSNEGLPKELC